MNRYIKNVDRIEFSVTSACTGSCKHCSEGGNRKLPSFIKTDKAVEAVRSLCALYNISSVMTFGGEPLLHPEAVFAIHRAATEAGVPKRQLITNGCFTNNGDRLISVVRELKACGVNDLLLSADAFHQETLPLATVKSFAAAVMEAGIPMRISPAWLVSREDTNPYNLKTRAIVAELTAPGVTEGEGNVVFPRGNALLYLKEYFEGRPAEPNPYEEDPRDLHTVSIDACGDTLGGNIYSKSILDLIREYDPL